MYKKFDDFCTKLLNNIIATVLIFVIGFTIFATISYNIFDFKYATEENFQPLYQTQQSIIDDFETVYTFSNTALDITDSNIVVYIYGNDCYIKTSFDKTKTYQNTEEFDTTDPIWFTTTLLLIVSVIGSMIFYLLFVVTLAVIHSLLRKISEPRTTKGRDIEH